MDTQHTGGEPPGVFQLLTCNSETGWVPTISCCLSIAIAMLVHVIDMCIK